MHLDGEAEAIELRLLLEAIHARYGYDLRDYAPKSIRRRVLSALASSGLGHLGELQHKILADPGFFAEILEALTVRVTEMFRDPHFQRTFRTRVVPVLRTYPLLRIWHSGCATGEEAYACAIVLAEEGLYDRAQIYATDLSSQAIEHAKHGVYSAERAREFGENYEKSGGSATLDGYYNQAYDRIAVRDSLRRNILFFQHDLVSDHVFGEMQVVFCRNVLMYFNPDLKDRVIKKFADSLCPGGFLCLGSGERLPQSSRGPFAEFAAEDRIYRHEG
jgi:chemotaxis protein methyltransferase CheR